MTQIFGSLFYYAKKVYPGSNRDDLDELEFLLRKDENVPRVVHILKSLPQEDYKFFTRRGNFPETLSCEVLARESKFLIEKSVYGICLIQAKVIEVFRAIVMEWIKGDIGRLKEGMDCEGVYSDLITNLRLIEPRKDPKVTLVKVVDELFDRMEFNGARKLSGYDTRDSLIRVMEVRYEKDEGRRLEILDSLIRCDLDDFVVQNIDVFNISNPIKRIECIHLFVSKGFGSSVISNFNKFTIPEESVRFDILLALASDRKVSNYNYLLLLHFNLFGLNLEFRDRFIEFVFSESNSIIPFRIILSFLKELGFETMESRFQIVQRFIDLGDMETIIQDFESIGIENPDLRIQMLDRFIQFASTEILCSDYDFYSASTYVLLIENFEQFNVLEEHVRMAYFTRFACDTRLVYALIGCIENFNITSEENNVLIIENLFIEKDRCLSALRRCAKSFKEFKIRDEYKRKVYLERFLATNDPVICGTLAFDMNAEGDFEITDPVFNSRIFKTLYDKGCYESVSDLKQGFIKYKITDFSLQITMIFATHRMETELADDSSGGM